MGILGLSKLLGDYAPSSMKENEFKNYFGKIFMIHHYSLNPSFTTSVILLHGYDVWSHSSLFTLAHGVKQCSKLVKTYVAH